MLLPYSEPDAIHLIVTGVDIWDDSVLNEWLLQNMDLCSWSEARCYRSRNAGNAVLGILHYVYK